MCTHGSPGARRGFERAKRRTQGFCLRHPEGLSAARHTPQSPYPIQASLDFCATCVLPRGQQVVTLFIDDVGPQMLVPQERGRQRWIDSHRWSPRLHHGRSWRHEWQFKRTEPTSCEAEVLAPGNAIQCLAKGSSCLEVDVKEKGLIRWLRLTTLSAVAGLLLLSWAAAQTYSISDYPPDVQAWLQTVKDNYGGTTINVSMGTHPSTDAFKKMAPEFEQLTGIKVNWDVISEPNLRPKHFALATGNANPFDVWMVDGFYIQEYVKKDTLFPLSHFLDNSTLTATWFDYNDILPAFRQAIATVDGQPYAVPTAGESRFIAYRKDLFLKYGLTPPSTTDELLKDAQYFADNVPGVYGMVSRARQGVFFASGWLHVLYQFSDGWIDQKTGAVLADSPGVVQSLQYWIDLLRTGPPDIASYTHEEASSAFNQGKAALWFDATAIAGWLLDPARSDYTADVGFLPPPEGPKGRFGGLAGWNLAVPRTAPHADAGWAFIEWMTSKLNAHKYLNDGGVLVRQSLLDDPSVTSQNPDLYKALNETFAAAAALTQKGLVWIPPTWLANPVLQKAGEWGSKALLGEISADQACKNLAADIRQMQAEWQ